MCAALFIYKTADDFNAIYSTVLYAADNILQPIMHN